MNSYRNFSPSPRNGWIIAWMSNYSVRFLRQREWDKVTLLLPLPPFRFIPHLTKPSSIETCIVINNFHRHHSKEKRKNIDTKIDETKKKKKLRWNEKRRRKMTTEQSFTPTVYSSDVRFDPLSPWIQDCGVSLSRCRSFPARLYQFYFRSVDEWILISSTPTRVLLQFCLERVIQDKRGGGMGMRETTGTYRGQSWNR